MAGSLSRPPYAMYGTGGAKVASKRQIEREQVIQELLGQTVGKCCRLYVDKALLAKTESGQS